MDASKKSVPTGLVSLCTVAALALGTADLAAQISSEDYARAERMLGWNASKLVFNAPVEPEWLEEDDRFWYRKRVPDGHEFIYVDPTNERRPAFDHTRLAAALSTASGTSYEPHKLPFEEFEYVDNDSAIQFWEGLKKETAEAQKEEKEVAEGKEEVHRRWRCRLTTYDCVGPEDVPKDPVDEVESPDGQWVAFEREENLWIRSTETDDEIQLSQDGEEHFGYAVNAEGCCYEISSRRAEEKRKPILFWSPDSTKIATHKLDERNVEPLHLLETHEGRPILHSYRYAMPGDEVVPTYQLHIFDIESRAQTPVGSEPIEMFTSAEDVHWGEDSRAIYFVHEFRGHQRAVLYTAEATTGQVRAILEERSKTFLDLPRNEDLQDWRVINDGQEVIWWSERDGWGHFYLFDAQSGAVKDQITAGPWVARTIHHVDEENRWLYFEAFGKEEGLYSYAAQLYRVGLDGSGLRRLTPEDAAHELEMSPSGSYVVDSYSTRETAPVTVLRQPDGRVIRTLEEADISQLLDAGWSPPELFSVKARDGVTDLYGFLYRPSNFDPEKKYPIIDYIYPGPQIGPIRFRGFTAAPRRFVQATAEVGFIVIQLDAMGTPFRSKAFHDLWYADMGDNGLIDHVHAIKQLAARHPEIDSDRVGIYGHSGGGFSSTGAILRFPDFFKVAVSGAGNHDNRSYSFGWGEKYQGLLEKAEDGSDNYESQANHLLAGNLKGHLLLTYGTLDDNVHPNATLLLINELIKHNKNFDLLILPNRNHRYAEEPYVVRRTWDYFVEHLLGDEPPVGYKVESEQ